MISTILISGSIVTSLMHKWFSLLIWGLGTKVNKGLQAKKENSLIFKLMAINTLRSGPVLIMP